MVSHILTLPHLKRTHKKIIVRIAHASICGLLYMCLVIYHVITIYLNIDLSEELNTSKTTTLKQFPYSLK